MLFFKHQSRRIITHQPRGGWISSYLQFHSSRFKSIGNFSSSANANPAAAGIDRSRRRNALSLHLGVLTASPLSLWSAARSHEGTAWKYVDGQLKSSSVETISGIYFLSFVYFKLQEGNFAHWQLRRLGLSVLFWRTLTPRCFTCLITKGQEKQEIYCWWDIIFCVWRRFMRNFHT